MSTAIELRPYQIRAGEMIARAHGEGAREIVCVVPTGGGKTIIMRDLIERFLRRGRRIAACAHRKELVGQLSEKLRDVGVPHGVILAGQPRTKQPVQVCSVQTLTASGEAPDADVLILDEAHHVCATTWTDIVRSYDHLELVLGFTATPERGDGAPLGDVFRRLVAPVSIGELMRLGYLLPCDVIAPAAAQKELAEDPVRAYQRLCPGAKAVVFCATVDHARGLAEAFTRAGVRAACVDGQIAPDRRLAILGGRDRFGKRIPSMMERGELEVLTNVNVLTEGFDAPQLSACIIARGCSTTGTLQQMIGRVLRPEHGTARPGERALVIDLRGHVYNHGLPDEDRKYSLTGKAIASAAARLALRQCKVCGAVDRPRERCARCGARMFRPGAPELRVTPIRRVTEEDVRANQATRRRFFEALRERPEASGSVAKAWIAAQYRMRFQADVPRDWWAPAEIRIAPADREMWAAFCEMVGKVRAGEWKKAAVFMAFNRRFGRAPKWRFENVPADESSRERGETA
jgi:superfamily II DNA or RNA helicase